MITLTKENVLNKKKHLDMGYPLKYKRQSDFKIVLPNNVKSIQIGQNLVYAYLRYPYILVNSYVVLGKI